MSVRTADSVSSLSASGEIGPLTSIRGLAALWVVAFHLFENLARHGIVTNDGGPAYRIIQAGQFGVDIFFVLSGFIIATTYGALAPADISKFLYRRLARVYPLHFVVLMLMALGVYALERTGRAPGDAEFFAFSALPYHFTLTFAWFGLPVGWNTPAWSLSIELLAYGAFPIILMLKTRMPKLGRALLALLAIVASSWTLSLWGFTNTGMGAIERGLLGFLIGVMMQSLAPSGFRTPAIALGAFMVLAALAVISDVSIIAAPITAAILIPALAGAPRDPFSRTMATASAVQLGRVSYSIYLLHIPLMIVWLNLLRLPFFAAGSRLSIAVFIISYGEVLLFVSQVTYSVIEKPARSALQSIWERRTVDAFG